MSKAPVAGQKEALLRAMMDSAAMDETRDYLTRGRAHAHVPEDALKDNWVKAFKTWFLSRDKLAQRDADDLTAELRLRRLEPPYERIAAESEVMADEIRREGPHSSGVRDKIEKFRGDLRERKN